MTDVMCPETPLPPQGGGLEETASRWAVEADRVTKHFGRVQVLSGVDLRVPTGRVTGLVGPNAAGKSTLIKCLLGLVRPDGGRLGLLGQPVSDDERYRARIGYMPQTARFPENLTAREVITMIRDLRAAWQGGGADEELLAGFRLAAELDKPIRTLSGGTRQKLNASLAFLYRPELLILDEPTAGLDPVASGLFKDKLTRARAEGASVLIASHTMSELEELADDVIFLLEGRVRFHGPVQHLIEVTGFARLERAIAAMMGAQP
jgi:Cu-processing system ATP-binding protein